MFMFKKYARIWLRATEDARLEHLHDITEEEAKAEGVRLIVNQNKKPMIPVTARYVPKDWTFREFFFSLWAELHRKPGERVEDNPELVRMAFKLEEVK